MTRLCLLLLPAAALAASIPGETDLSASPHVKVRSIGMTDARWTGGFWGERMKLARTVMAPGIRKTYDKRGNGSWMGNLRIAAGEVDTAVPGAGRVRLAQRTDYPWSGAVRFDVQAAPPGQWALMLRIPEWAAGARVSVNGAPWREPLHAGTYAALGRAWKAGDRVELDLPMQPRLIEGHPYNEFTRGQAALARGPVVYCLESPDLPAGVRVDEVRLDSAVRFEARHGADLPGGVTVLEGSARRARGGAWGNRLYRPLQPGGEAVRVRLIPYYAWGNRGVSHMTVWMPLGD
jgi:uncharacterized protein